MASQSRSVAAASLKAFTLFEGVLMLVLGILALAFPVRTSGVITAVVAVAFLVGGLVGWVSNLMRARQLGRWLSHLTAQEREVLALRFGLDGQERLTLAEIGRHLEVSRERVRQVELKALRKLRNLTRR